MTDESGHDKEQHDQLSTSNQSNNAYDSIDPSQTVIRPAPTPTPQPPSGPEILADGRSTGPADQPGRPDGGFGQPAAGSASVVGEPQRQPQTMPPNPPLPNQLHQSGGFAGPQGGPRFDQPNGPRPGWPSGWQAQGHSGPYGPGLQPGQQIGHPGVQPGQQSVPQPGTVPAYPTQAPGQRSGVQPGMVPNPGHPGPYQTSLQQGGYTTTQPLPTMPAAGQAPMMQQPYQGALAVQPSGNWFADAWGVLRRIWRGDVVEAFDLATASRKFWLWTGLAQAGFAGFAFANLMWRVTSSIDNGANRVTHGFLGRFGMDDPSQTYNVTGFEFSSWLKAFFTMFLAVAVVFAVRPLFIKMVYAWRQSRQTWEVAYTVNSVATLSSTFVVAVVSLLWFVPSGALVPVGLVMLWALGAMCQFLGELLLYTGVNKTGEFPPYSRSPLVPHVIGTGFYVVVVIVLWLLCAAVAGGITS